MRKVNFQYALGEVLIVIIGITIAFSLNKCSHQKENKKLSEMYLTNLKRELEQDKINLESNIKKFEIKKNKIAELSTILSTNTNLEGKHNMLVFEISDLEKFYPNNVTYNTLINSGDFKLIDDFELRKSLEEHYNNIYNVISDEYERLENIHKEYLADLYIYQIDYDKFRTNEFVFDDKRLLINILKSTEGASQFAINASQTGYTNCERLLELIEAYER